MTKEQEAISNMPLGIAILSVENFDGHITSTFILALRALVDAAKKQIAAENVLETDGNTFGQSFAAAEASVTVMPEETELRGMISGSFYQCDKSRSFKDGKEIVIAKKRGKK